MVLDLESITTAAISTSPSGPVTVNTSVFSPKVADRATRMPKPSLYTLSLTTMVSSAITGTASDSASTSTSNMARIRRNVVCFIMAPFQNPQKYFRFWGVICWYYTAFIGFCKGEKPTFPCHGISHGGFRCFPLVIFLRIVYNNPNTQLRRLRYGL